MEPAPPWQLYERHAELWAEVRTDDLTLERKWLARFCELLEPGDRVLDLGCGHGRPIGAQLLRCGFDVWGLDRAPAAIEAARSALPAGTWLVGDMAAFDLDQTLHGFVMWHSFFHLPAADQRKVFPLIRAHAEPEAVLMFTTGNEAGSADGTFGGDTLAHHSLDPVEYTALLDEQGFEVVDHVESDPDAGAATVWLARMTHGEPTGRPDSADE